MPRILVVDDDELVRDLTVQILERNGYDVVAVPAADEALTFLEREPVDLVVTDIVMPGKSGLELLDDIRARHAPLPVVLMTGGAPRPEFATAVASQSAPIVFKPFSHRELTRAVEAALGGAPV